MNIAFRVDASPVIGTGHLARCLALATALRALGAHCSFVTRSLGLDSIAWIALAGFDAIRLPAPPRERIQTKASDTPHSGWAGVTAALDAEQACAVLQDLRPHWWVVDHYALDSHWHDQVAATLGCRICVIDDLADRPLHADLLVDHNPSPDHRAKYRNVVPHVRRLLGGPRFALLGAHYATAARYAFRQEVQSIGIFLGGTDQLGISAVALRACRSHAGFDGPIQVATTSHNPHLASLTQLAAELGPTEVLVDLPDLAAFFARHDLQIGAGGGAAWERCCIGAPTLTLQWADNQAVVVDALARRDASRVCAQLTSEAIGREVAALIADPAARRSLSEQSMGWVDGRGAQRAALAIYADELSLRPAEMADAELAHAWRNDARTRLHFRHPQPVPLNEHLAWWARTLGDDARRLLIAACGSRSVGSVRFDIAGQEAEVSLYLDPELTGLGLGQRMLVAASAWLAAQRMGVRRIVAEVLAANTSSARAFRGAGFLSANARHWSLEMPQ
jgi:UDP-2,4-diacetamido-2,4,6-trideoxy-beta-L-altropyranose hydrolase